jgi:hypothetical protein
VRIDDLARKMVHLSGLEVKDDNNPNGDIEIHYIGLRPGEKIVIGPFSLICLVNSGITEPLEPNTLPKRTIVN